MKSVFITGASRGIGNATATKFAQNGWQVAGFYKNNPGPNISGVNYFQMDVTNRDSVTEAMKQAIDKLGSMDCLVNCAGIFGDKDLPSYDEKLIDDVMATNEKGTYWCTQEAIVYMKKGSIVNISSAAGQVGSGADPIYAATKGAVLAFTKSMARALAPDIRVNSVAPGMVDTEMVHQRKWGDVAYVTDMTPLGKMATPQDIADAIYFLASDDAGHITGACLDVNGGYSLR